MYISNGAAVALATRSPGAKGPRDLFFMALLAPFRGYYPGYSDEIRARHDGLTWTILKARNANRGAGHPALGRSARPASRQLPPLRGQRRRPAPTSPPSSTPSQFARKMAEPLRKRGLLADEEEPGPAVRTPAEIADYVRANAWGHHASGTCAIGPREAGGVLASDFRVPRNPRPARRRRVGLPRNPRPLHRLRRLPWLAKRRPT